MIPAHANAHAAIPRPVLMMMGGLMALSIALASLVSFGIMDREAVPSVARAEAGVVAAQERQLFFADESDGAVTVTDAASGDMIARFEPGTGGFIRSTVRSLAHHRRLNGIGAATPFTLTRWDDEGLTLADPETGRSVELVSFGKDNEAIFAALLEQAS